MTTYISATDTAALIRRALRASFPGTKFSVRTVRYSGGASIDVRWTDGPTDTAVSAVVEGFEGGKLDVTGDFIDPVTHEVDGERIRYGARHIWTERRISDGVYAAIEPEVLAALDLETADPGRSYPVPPLVLSTCEHWHYERATIWEFVRAIANSRGVAQG